MSYSAHPHLLMPWKRHLTTAFLYTVIYNITWKNAPSRHSCIWWCLPNEVQRTKSQVSITIIIFQLFAEKTNTDWQKFTKVC